MNINLNEKIAEHFDRIEALAKEAAEDEAQSYSSRTSAMNGLTTIIKELTKTQAEIVNMERLMRIERITIETVKEFLNSDQCELFLERLEEMINAQ